ncbi:MAG: SGNH/GDSL hydrolase family protein [Peptococcaceae bacterium]|nr:SGNH/GDSL hydrolase family protein [Peptococcaceae bacterium]
MDIIKDNYHFIISGDSISKGVILDEKRKKYIVSKNNYVSILQQKLKGVAYNLSKFGATITYGVNKLHKILALQRADFVLIEYGGNDCDFNWDEVANTPEENHCPRTDLNTFEQTLKDTVHFIKAKGIVPILMTLPPLNADLYLKWISKNNPLKEKNILRWLGSVTKIYWWQERYNAVIIKVAEETQTTWIDIRRAFLLQPDFSKFLCSDGIHPNEAGQKLIADKILEYIKINSSYLIKDDADKILV